MLPRRPRLKNFSYTGRYRYFLTFCTFDRSRIFVSDKAVALMWSQILRASAECAFNIIAHVAMPDHLHVLVEAMADGSDLKRFASLAKQRSAFEYRRVTNRRLWQPSYYDHVLRDDESSLPFIRYIFENPVTAGLVQRCDDYPYLGAGPVPVPEMLRELNEAGVAVWQPAQPCAVAALKGCATGTGQP
ncbi:MAG TPA: transposase [Vicinamibacterales bacterium]|nr:transposase [Vicinamibacterales bacterium]